MYEVWVDGACRQKKVNKKWTKLGYASIGVVIKKDGQVIHKHHSYLGDEYDNNQAEYEALIYAIDKMIEYEVTSVVFMTDSNLVEKQMNDKYGAYSDLIVPLYMKAKKLIQMIPEYKVKLIKREQNREADKLTKIALDQYFKENKITI